MQLSYHVSWISISFRWRKWNYLNFLRFRVLLFCSWTQSHLHYAYNVHSMQISASFAKRSNPFNRKNLLGRKCDLFIKSFKQQQSPVFMFLFLQLKRCLLTFHPTFIQARTEWEMLKIFFLLFSGEAETNFLFWLLFRLFMWKAFVYNEEDRQIYP